MTRHLKLFAIEAALPLVLLVWWWFASAGSVNPFYPPLADIAQRFGELWFGPAFVTHVLPSVRNVLIGFALASAIGVLLGYLLTAVPLLGRMFDPLIYFFQAVPNVALLPVALVLLGIGPQMHTFMIVLAATPSILLNAIEGFRGLDPTLGDTMGVYPVSRMRRLLHVEIPSASPHIFAGMRTGLRRAVIMMVAAEMVGSSAGLGYFTLQSSRTFRVEEMWAGILLLGIIGYLLNVVFQFFEKRALAWYEASKGVAQ